MITDTGDITNKLPSADQPVSRKPQTTSFAMSINKFHAYKLLEVSTKWTDIGCPTVSVDYSHYSPFRAPMGLGLLSFVMDVIVVGVRSNGA